MVHVFREVNRCVDVLANLGCDLGASHEFFDVPPASLGHLLISDVM